MRMPDAITTNAENQLVRIPSSTRLNTSRPCSSMPIQCAADGPVSDLPTTAVSLDGTNNGTSNRKIVRKTNALIATSSNLPSRRSRSPTPVFGSAGHQRRRTGATRTPAAIRPSS